MAIQGFINECSSIIDEIIQHYQKKPDRTVAEKCACSNLEYIHERHQKGVSQEELFEDLDWLRKIRASIFWSPSQEIRALSWKQPFATLMLHGKIETRTWQTNYRGWVLICASQNPYYLDEELRICGETQFGRIDSILKDSWPLPIGVAIAIGFLADCRPMKKADENACFVKYREGLYCHIYNNVQAIEPFEWKGSQGWKTVPEDIKAIIKLKK